MLHEPLEESNVLDLKREWSGKHSALEDLAAFANTSGGSVFIGVEDNGKVIGFDPSDSELRTILSQIVDVLRLYPEVNRIPTQNGLKVLELRVQKATTLISCKGRYLIRVGTTNRDMTSEELARRSLELSGQSWDSLPTGQTFPVFQQRHPDINPEAIKQFVRLSNKRLPYASETDSAQAILENLNLLRESRPTRAALLCFGNRPQDIAVGAVIRIARFINGQIVDDKTMKGTLIDQLEATLMHLQTHLTVRYEIADRAKLDTLKSPSLLERIQRRETWEYPLEALREAIVNALIHRDYTDSSDIQIRILDDQFSIWNPGNLDPELSLEMLHMENHVSKRRNPSIAEVFHALDLVERWGTGTTRIIRECKANGLPAPEFSSQGGFKVVFYKNKFSKTILQKQGLSERQISILEFLDTLETAGISDFSQVLSTVSTKTIQRDLQVLILQGLVKADGTGKGRRYSRLA